MTDIKEKENGHISDIDYLIEQAYLQSGRIFLSTNVDDALAKYVIDRIRLYTVMGLPDIYLYINTDGGLVDSTGAIIDEMAGAYRLGASVHTIATGRAYSAGAIILAHGQTRYATRNANIMLHPVAWDTGADYVGMHKAYTDFASRRYNDMMSDVAKLCGRKTKKQIDEFIENVKEGLWLSPKEAIKFGIVDKIWDYSKEKELNERIKMDIERGV